jgi:hypothetical protein
MHLSFVHSNAYCFCDLLLGFEVSSCLRVFFTFSYQLFLISSCTPDNEGHFPDRFLPTVFHADIYLKHVQTSTVFPCLTGHLKPLLLCPLNEGTGFTNPFLIRFERVVLVCPLQFRPVYRGNWIVMGRLSEGIL